MTLETSVEVRQSVPHSPSRVWKVLTDRDLMARWLMPNDFRLEIGHRFTFRGPPIPAVGHDGVAHCEVLDFEAERFLAISFSGGDASGLQSTVTWTLRPTPEGTELTLLHHGFAADDPLQQLSRKMMSGGWPRVLQKLAELAADHCASE
ncbi:MAG TPA: SRPBCC domain-containing protein [Devosiaceae bacterium]|jgi:uncharacterized protein YndB with AHSA1/START domain|nr:SRPBCC domain-containing protein [Devosiaceae bacterium]